MFCYECEYEDTCDIRQSHTDVTGCKGHSKYKVVPDGYCRCLFCNGVFEREKMEAIVPSNGLPKEGICYRCC